MTFGPLHPLGWPKLSKQCVHTGLYEFRAVTPNTAKSFLICVGQGTVLAQTAEAHYRVLSVYPCACFSSMLKIVHTAFLTNCRLFCAAVL